MSVNKSICIFVCLISQNVQSRVLLNCNEVFSKFRSLVSIPVLGTKNIADIPTPIGLQRKDFETLVGHIQSHPAIKQNSTLVALYGSRTHFNWGHKPAASSDLDVFVLFDTKSTTNTVQQKLDILEEIKASLKPISEKSKIEMGVLPYLGNKKELFDPNHYSPLHSSKLNSAEAEKAVAKSIGRQGLDRKLEKTLLTESKSFIGKEAVIFVFKKGDWQDTLRQLRINGYSNIVLLE